MAETMGSFYELPQAYAVEGGGLASDYADSTGKHLGGGQYYLMAAKDEDCRELEGSRNYKLNVPAKVPVQQYWAAVVYDRARHAPIRNVPRLSRSSQSQGLQSNGDGSADLYFGPKAPAGKG